MARVTFEYTDDSGQVHQVGSASEVPTKYAKTAVAVGEPEEAQSQGSHAARSQYRDDKFVLPDFAKNPNFPVALGVVGAIVVLRSKNFVVKAVIISAASLWLFFRGYDWMMTSKYLQPAEKQAPGSLSSTP